MTNKIYTFLNNLFPEDLINYSQSTSSVYYARFGKIIRVSDHLSNHLDIDLQIITPINDGDYIVTVAQGSSFISLNLEQLKSFVTSLLLYWELSYKSTKFIVETKPSTSNLDSQENSSEIPVVWGTKIPLDSPERVSEDHTYGLLVEKHIIPVFPEWKKLSRELKKRGREVFTADVPFTDALAAIKELFLKVTDLETMDTHIEIYKATKTLKL